MKKLSIGLAMCLALSSLRYFVVVTLRLFDSLFIITGGFMGRLKTDLNKWLKDYFNDVMMHTDLSEISHMDELAYVF